MLLMALIWFSESLKFQNKGVVLRQFIPKRRQILLYIVVLLQKRRQITNRPHLRKNPVKLLFPSCV